MLISHLFTQLHLCSFCAKLLGESGIINFDHMQGKVKVIRLGGRCEWVAHSRLPTKAISADSRALRVPFEACYWPACTVTDQSQGH